MKKGPLEKSELMQSTRGRRGTFVVISGCSSLSFLLRNFVVFAWFSEMFDAFSLLHLAKQSNFIPFLCLKEIGSIFVRGLVFTLWR